MRFVHNPRLSQLREWKYVHEVWCECWVQWDKCWWKMSVCCNKIFGHYHMQRLFIFVVRMPALQQWHRLRDMQLITELWFKSNQWFMQVYFKLLCIRQRVRKMPSDMWALQQVRGDSWRRFADNDSGMQWMWGWILGERLEMCAKGYRWYGLYSDRLCDISSSPDLRCLPLEKEASTEGWRVKTKIKGHNVESGIIIAEIKRPWVPDIRQHKEILRATVQRQHKLLNFSRIKVKRQKDVQLKPETTRKITKGRVLTQKQDQRLQWFE